MEIGSAVAEIDAISATFAAILRLARMESGATKLVADETDVEQLLRDVCDLFNSAADGRYGIIQKLSQENHDLREQPLSDQLREVHDRQAREIAEDKSMQNERSQLPHLRANHNVATRFRRSG